MIMKAQFPGSRALDGHFPENPGEYSLMSVTDGVPLWIVCAPDGGSKFQLANRLYPDSNGRVHEVEEHEDGTITVAPKPHNSNSILSPGGWHGWIYRGVWCTEVNESHVHLASPTRREPLPLRPE